MVLVKAGPRYDARIEDLGPGDFVRVEGAACGSRWADPAGWLGGWAAAADVDPCSRPGGGSDVASSISATRWSCRSGGLIG